MKLARLSSYLLHSWARLLQTINTLSTTFWLAFLPKVCHPHSQSMPHIQCHYILLCSRPVFPFPSSLSASARPQGPFHHLAPCYLPNTLASQQAQPNTLTLTSGLLPALFAYPEIASAYSNPTSAYIQVPTPPESSPDHASPQGFLPLNVSASKIEHTYLSVCPVLFCFFPLCLSFPHPKTRLIFLRAGRCLTRHQCDPPHPL